MRIASSPGRRKMSLSAAEWDGVEESRLQSTYGTVQQSREKAVKNFDERSASGTGGQV